MESILAINDKRRYKCLTCNKRLTNFIVIKSKHEDGKIKEKTYCDYYCIGSGYRDLFCVLCGAECHLTKCDKIINMEGYTNILKLCSPKCSREIVTLIRKLDERTLEAACKNCEKYTKDLKICAKCRFTYYCSRECQKKDWKEHKEDCTLITMNE